MTDLSTFVASQRTEERLLEAMRRCTIWKLQDVAKKVEAVVRAYTQEVLLVKSLRQTLEEQGVSEDHMHEEVNHVAPELRASLREVNNWHRKLAGLERRLGMQESGGGDLKARVALVRSALLAPAFLRRRLDSLRRACAKLDEIVGLKSMKQYVFRALRAFAQNWKFCQSHLNMTLTGPPGVGKTVVASRIGEVFGSCGMLLFHDKVRVVSPNDFIGFLITQSDRRSEFGMRQQGDALDAEPSASLAKLEQSLDSSKILTWGPTVTLEVRPAVSFPS